MVVVSGPPVSPDVGVHATSTAHTTTDPTNPLVFTTHLQTSRVQSVTAQKVEDNGPTALLAALDESIRASLPRLSPAPLSRASLPRLSPALTHTVVRWSTCLRVGFRPSGFGSEFGHPIG